MQFGLFGLHSDDIDDPVLNYVGVSLALVSLGLTILVEPTDAASAGPDDAGHAIPEPTGSISLGKPLLESVADDLEEGGPGVESSEAVSAAPSSSAGTWVSRLGPRRARLAGVCMAVLMGCFFGFSFDPAQYLMDNRYDDDDGGRVDPLDYVFSHLCGIFASSCFYYALYVASCGGFSNTWKDAALVGPAMLSGVMWAIAQVCWFVANGALGFSIAFPLITSGPGLVAALVGIVLFGEIQVRASTRRAFCKFVRRAYALTLFRRKTQTQNTTNNKPSPSQGAKNFAVLGLAFALTVSANVCIVMSR